MPVSNDRVVPVAIDTQLLRKRPVFGFTAAERRFVVLTSAAGANRVYAADVEFPDQPWTTALVDASGHRWQVTESALVRADRADTTLLRVSAQRAFWFGWYGHFPDTLLIK